MAITRLNLLKKDRDRFICAFSIKNRELTSLELSREFLLTKSAMDKLLRRNGAGKGKTLANRLRWGRLKQKQHAKKSRPISID